MILVDHPWPLGAVVVVGGVDEYHADKYNYGEVRNNPSHEGTTPLIMRMYGVPSRINVCMVQILPSW
jgi:hypothetical protein